MKSSLLKVITALCISTVAILSAAGALHISADNTVFDFEGKTCEDVMNEFIEENGLNEYNFAMNYENTVTHESCSFNDMHTMVPASTYKLPLNMYYYEMEECGEITSDTYIPGTGYTLSQCHYKSIVESDNDVSNAMQNYLGNYSTYKTLMTGYYTIPEDEIPADYYYTNRYTTRMMMDVLTYLFDNQERFTELIDYMLIACPDHFFKHYSGDIPVAHKYGDYEGAENDVGIIYTDEPFLLAVYSQGVGERIPARAAELFIAYTEYTHKKAVEESESIAAYESSVEASVSESESIEASVFESESMASVSASVSVYESESVAASIYESESLAEESRILAEQEAAEYASELKESKIKCFAWVGFCLLVLIILIDFEVKARARKNSSKKRSAAIETVKNVNKRKKK